MNVPLFYETMILEVCNQIHDKIKVTKEKPINRQNFFSKPKQNNP